MKATILFYSSLFGVVLVTSSSFVVAAEPADVRVPKITHENLYQMEELVKQGADPNEPIWYARKLRVGETEHPADAPAGEYPLDAAIQSMNADLVQRLLALGAEPKRNELGGAAFLTNKSAALAMARILVDAGMDPSGTNNPQDLPPLELATCRGNVKLVRFLLAQPTIDIDKRDIDGQTALIVAATYGHPMIVDLLMQAGADPSLKNERGGTAADGAREGIAKFQTIIERMER